MHFSKPITKVIAQRYSCRTYTGQPIEPETRQKLDAFLASLSAGRFGTPLRLRLLAASEADRDTLRGLGTYGIIRGATDFLVGAVSQGPRNMQEIGYALEQAVLLATDLGLGTCWLGGTFTRSSFAARLELRADEAMPAVVSVGYIADKRSLVDRLMRRGARSATRLPWEQLFFDGRFGVPLAREQAGAFAVPLEMLRLAPSASNKQPWRVVRDGPASPELRRDARHAASPELRRDARHAASPELRRDAEHAAWHLYLQRTPGYSQIRSGALRVGDLQRVDLGIAMCHFELTAQEAGLSGGWTFEQPAPEGPDEWTEYVATWR